MNVRSLAAFLLLILAAPLIAQTPTATPTTTPATPALTPEDLGFTYTLPAGWEAIDAQSTLPEVKKHQAETARNDEEKKEIACIQIPVSARHGAPPSFVAAIVLPFDCFGQVMTEKELPGFAEGSSQGPRAVFDFADPVYNTYTMGSHSMWIERAKGNPKGHPEMGYTLEIACSLLKKTAVCWMTMAGDDQALKDFEATPVTLDGDSFPQLVPPTAFDKKPAA